MYKCIHACTHAHTHKHSHCRWHSIDNFGQLWHVHENMLHIQTWTDKWIVMPMPERNCIKADRCRDRPPLNRIYEHYLVRSGRGRTRGKELSCAYLVDNMAKYAIKRLGLLKIVSPYLNPNQRATINNNNNTILILRYNPRETEAPQQKGLNSS